MASLMYSLVLSIFCLVVYIIYRIIRPTRYTGPPVFTSAPRGVLVHILVLGDIGRSPRMTYHALSIAKHGGRVNLIGYLESSLHPDVIGNANIKILPLPAPPARPGFIPFLLYAPWKVLTQLYHLSWLLTYGLEPAQWLLVQNPPSIPTLAIASSACHLRNTKLMIDWHNYGWTILAGRLGARHPLVYMSKLYECYLGRLGFFHLAVTNAMVRELRKPPYRISSPMVPVHDRPTAIFQPIISTVVRSKTRGHVVPDKDLVPRLQDGSMALIVSSTSWTPDEDFSMLLDALTQYAGREDARPVLAVITGKGPQKDMYSREIAALTLAGRLPNVTISTAFLSFADYAALLASADLGVCLHRSSSGVDLPMKVVDMFGAGLPVVAYAGYESFGELVKEGENGRGFETAEELADILGSLLHPQGKVELDRLRKGAVKEGSRRWDEEWDSTVGKIMGLSS